MMNDGQIGRNIKALRMFYEETQLELAEAIDIDSPNAISNYEKGKRTPKKEILSKIALHYHITEDELQNSDLSFKRNGRFDIKSREKIVELYENAFPMISTDAAKSNDSFIKGYLAQVYGLERMKKTGFFPADILEECLDAYEDAKEKYNIPEALCNAVGLVLMFLQSKDIVENLTMEGDDEDYIKLFQFSNEELMKKYYLRSFSQKDPINVTKSVELTNDYNSFVDEIIEALSELKKYPEYFDLAEYYVAMLYLSGCSINGLSSDLNKSIGNDLLRTLARLNNKYAICFFNFFS